MRAEEEKGLQDFPQLLSVAHSAGAYAQPLLRRRILRCGNALAAHNRWNDLLQLTDGLDGKAEHVPVEIAFLRDYALQRSQRVPEAKLLMLELAQSPVVKRKNSQQLTSLHNVTPRLCLSWLRRQWEKRRGTGFSCKHYLQA